MVTWKSTHKGKKGGSAFELVRSFVRRERKKGRRKEGKLTSTSTPGSREMEVCFSNENEECVSSYRKGKGKRESWEGEGEGRDARSA